MLKILSIEHENNKKSLRKIRTTRKMMLAIRKKKAEISGTHKERRFREFNIEYKPNK